MSGVDAHGATIRSENRAGARSHIRFIFDHVYTYSSQREYQALSGIVQFALQSNCQKKSSCNMANILSPEQIQMIVATLNFVLPPMNRCDAFHQLAMLLDVDEEHEWPRVAAAFPPVVPPRSVAPPIPRGLHRHYLSCKQEALWYTTNHGFH